MYSVSLDTQQFQQLKLVFTSTDRSQISISIDTSESVRISGDTYKFYRYTISIVKDEGQPNYYVVINEPIFSIVLRLNPGEQIKLQNLLTVIVSKVSSSKSLSGGKKKKRKSKKTNRKY